MTSHPRGRIAATVNFRCFQLAMMAIIAVSLFLAVQLARAVPYNRALLVVELVPAVSLLGAICGLSFCNVGVAISDDALTVQKLIRTEEQITKESMVSVRAFSRHAFFGSRFLVVRTHQRHLPRIIFLSNNQYSLILQYNYPVALLEDSLGQGTGF